MSADITNWIPKIVLAVIIITALLIIRKVGRSVGRGVRNIRAVFSLFSGAASSVQSQANHTPRQLQNLTNTYTEIIRRDFPEFDAKEFLTSAENTLVSVLNSLESGNIDNKSKLSPNLMRKLEETITDIKSKGEKWFFNDIYVHKSCIAKYNSLAGSKMIRVEIALQYGHGIYKNGKMISGSNTIQQYKYSIDAVYVQDVTKLGTGSMHGHNCPNCGAPVKQLGEGKFCSYCGTGLKEVNVRIWTFDNYSRC